jgi:hypothetical protein
MTTLNQEIGSAMLELGLGIENLVSIADRIGNLANDRKFYELADSLKAVKSDFEKIQDNIEKQAPKADWNLFEQGGRK